MSFVPNPSDGSRSSEIRRQHANQELLKNLLARNHSEHALLHHKVLHNHLPHLLGSVYLLNGTTTQLNEAYSHESAGLEARSSHGLSRINNDEELREHLGDITYQEDFMEFFDSIFSSVGNNWRDFTASYLLQGPEPLLAGLVGGFGHPLIQLADAFELQSLELAAEALSLNAIDYNDLCKFFSIPGNNRTGKPTSSPDKILSEVASDSRFTGILSHAGIQNIVTLLTNQETKSAILEYFLKIDLSDIPTLVTQLADLAVLLACAAHKPGEPAIDFYLNHALTFVWCLKVLLPVFPRPDDALVLVRCVWLLIVLAYVTELRPVLTPALIEDVTITPGIGWEAVFQGFYTDDDLQGKYLDAHFLRAMRNLMELGKMKKNETFYLRAAMKLSSEWKGWSGLANEGEVELNVQP